MQYLRGSDVLVALSGADVLYAIPYKIFDYISTGIPVLAITPENSELTSFMRDGSFGIAASPNDPAGISSALIKCINNKKRATVKKDFLWQARGLDYAEFLQKMIDNPWV